MKDLPWYKYHKRNYYNRVGEVGVKPWVPLIGLLVCALAVAVFGNVMLIKRSYSMFKSSGAQYILARDAPNATLISKYLDKLDTGLDEQHALSGSTALVFKADNNDIGIYRTNLTQLRERAQQAATIAPDNISYQYAITNLKSAVSNIGTIDNGLLWVRYWWLYFLTVIAYVAVGIFGIWFLVVVYDYRY